MRERKANRLNVWDYNSMAYYFITVNTKYMIHYFGKVHDNSMQLSEIGQIAHQCWMEIPEHNRDVFLENFVIMPNHIHGIIRICSFQRTAPIKGIAPQYKRIPVIMGSFKSAVSKLVHEKGFKNFSWHKSYYDHIVRDKKDLNRIQRYISNNPVKWGMRESAVQ